MGTAEVILRVLGMLCGLTLAAMGLLLKREHEDLEITPLVLIGAGVFVLVGAMQSEMF